MSLAWDIGDPEVDAFVDGNLVSFAAWDLVIYLDRHPDARETLSAYAAILSRQEADLRPALRHFVDAGIVELADPGDGQAEQYRLSTDTETRRVVTRFVRCADKRDHRFEFVRRVLARLTE